MKIDYPHAKEVFALMLERYRDRRHPFSDANKDLPQFMVLPEIAADEIRLARHLFFACHYMRGTVISGHAFNRLNELQQEFPWLFAKEVLDSDATTIAEILKTKIVWQCGPIGRAWLSNAQVLNQEWDFDPRNIFSDVKRKETLYRRVMGPKYRRRGNTRCRYTGFIGFREKMTSMLAYFLESTGLIEPTKLSAPIDFHHFRVYLATGMIKISGHVIRYEKIMNLGIELAERLQREFSLSQVEYGDIVWLWSLRSCRRSPHNRTVKVDGDEGKIIRLPVPIIWDKSQIDAHERTCGRCHISDHCLYGVPAGVYYTRGVFRLLPREGPPQQSLFRAMEIPYD